MTPNYLRDHASLYRENPRAAALTWFASANYGLFLHYGLYSLLGRHEWVQYREAIPVAEYAKLAERFTAEGFNANHVAAFAVDCGMKYINFTSRHHDGFCLFDTAATPFNSLNSPAARDLVAELATACDRYGLGLFLYYAHGRDWRHPHAPNNDRWGGHARPTYQPPEPSYAYGEAHDLDRYLHFMSLQIRELLSNYGPIAGIWLDGIMVPLSDKNRTPYPQRPNRSDNALGWQCQALYDQIHSLQPQVLVSYKQGLLGSEDFLSCEHVAAPSATKPGEVCTTMCPGSWGYYRDGAGKHLSADDVWALLRNANEQHVNLLLNTGPLPDGSLDDEDERVLRQVGVRLRATGL